MTIQKESKAFLSVFLQLLLTRSELLAVEFTEEKIRFIKIIMTLIIFSIFTLLLFLIFFSLMLRLLWHSSALYWFLGLSGLFFAVGIGLTLFYFKRLVHAHLPFEVSLSVLKEDVATFKKDRG